MEKDNKKQFKEMMNRLAKVDKRELLKKNDLSRNK